jgi:hypothetical protein
LLDSIVIAVCAVICGADNWVEIEVWGQANEGWLKQFLDWPNGRPALDTFGRVFARLDETEFQTAFLAWVQSAYHLTGGPVIALNGKQRRRSPDRVRAKVDREK